MLEELRGPEAPDRLVVRAPDGHRELWRDVDPRAVAARRRRHAMDIGDAALDLFRGQHRGHPALGVLPGAAPDLGMVASGIDGHRILHRLREALDLLETDRAPPERRPALGEQ